MSYTHIMASSASLHEHGLTSLNAHVLDEVVTSEWRKLHKQTRQSASNSMQCMHESTTGPVKVTKSDMLPQASYKVEGNKTALANKDTISLQVFQKPFATGGCRLAYYAQDGKGTK